MNNRQVKIGAIFSYILIIANALWGFIVTPFILRMLGTSSYGVYKTISSLTSSMMVLDFGLGGTVMRYVAKYRVDCENEKIEPFISMVICEAFILIVLITVISFAFYFNIDEIYGNSFIESEIILARQIFFVSAIGVVAHFIENIFNGVITGYNNFILGNGIKVARLVARMMLTFVFLSSYKNAVVLVGIDLGLTIVSAFVEVIYIRSVYKLKVSLSFKVWDRNVFRESFIYTFLTFLTSIAAQINSNLDNVVIGAIRGADLVTIYSFGIVIFSMYEQLSTSISGVMLPTVTDYIKQDGTGEKVQDLVVRVGRIQFALLGAVTIGFIVLGKDFIQLWLGEGFEDVYIIALILMIPSLFELCVNVCLAVLRAKNILGFRTGILFATTFLNLVITVVGVSLWSYFAAAIGTAISFIVGSLIIMNIYYCKKLGFHMVSLYRRILNKIWVCLLIAGLSIYFSSRYIIGGWFALLANIMIFCVVYGFCLVLWGLNADERRRIPVINKLSFKRR